MFGVGIAQLQAAQLGFGSLRGREFFSSPPRPDQL